MSQKRHLDNLKKKRVTRDVTRNIAEDINDFILIVSVISVLSNILSRYPMRINYKWVVLVGVAIASHIDTRYYKRFAVEKWNNLMLGLVIIVMLPIAFLEQGRLTFVLIAYLYVSAVVVAFLTVGTMRKILVVGLFLISLSMVFAEAFLYQRFPELIQWILVKRENYFLDNFIQAIVTMLLVTIVVIRISNDWRYEKLRTDKYIDLLEEQNDKLEWLVSHDTLTRLYNRGFINDFLYNIDITADYIIGIFDIDDFKNINDTYGHTVGDQVIIAVANAIYRNVGNIGVVARYGGDEFIIALSGKCSGRIKEKMNQLVEDVKAIQIEAGMNISISGGVSLIRHDRTITENISSADKLLYQAKASGKNQIVYSKRCQEGGWLPEQDD